MRSKGYKGRRRRVKKIRGRVPGSSYLAERDSALVVAPHAGPVENGTRSALTLEAGAGLQEPIMVWHRGKSPTTQAALLEVGGGPPAHIGLAGCHCQGSGVWRPASQASSRRPVFSAERSARGLCLDPNPLSPSPCSLPASDRCLSSGHRRTFCGTPFASTRSNTSPLRLAAVRRCTEARSVEAVAISKAFVSTSSRRQARSSSSSASHSSRSSRST